MYQVQITDTRGAVIMRKAMTSWRDHAAEHYKQVRNTAPAKFTVQLIDTCNGAILASGHGRKK